MENINNSLEKMLKKTIKSENKKVLFIIWPEPLIVVSKQTNIDDSLTLLGLNNFAHESTIRYPQYSIEEVLRKNPDIIFIGQGHKYMKAVSDKLFNKLKRVNTVKIGQVYFISDNLYRLGPRVIEVLRELSKYIK